MTIAVRDLHVRYGDVHAVRGVDLDVTAGEVVAVLRGQQRRVEVALALVGDRS